MDLLGVWGAGFGNSLALIVAIGAQNALVLRAGIRGRYVGTMILVCVLSDVLLMTLGVLGVGAVLDRAPVLLQFATWAGAAFLLAYAGFAVRRAVRPTALVIADEPADATVGAPVDRVPSDVVAAAGSDGTSAVPVAAGPRERSLPRRDDGARHGLRGALLSILAVTYLNPHCYLDTVVLLGTISNSYGESLRWVFLAGGVTASAVWFPVLGFGARVLRPVFASPVAWRILDLLIAAVMTAIAIGLLLP